MSTKLNSESPSSHECVGNTKNFLLQYASVFLLILTLGQKRSFYHRANSNIHSTEKKETDNETKNLDF